MSAYITVVMLLTIAQEFLVPQFIPTIIIAPLMMETASEDKEGHITYIWQHLKMRIT